MSDDNPSHVDALIQKYARGRSVKQIERDAELSEGALSYVLRPSQRGKDPRLRIKQRFACALGATLEEVSVAFARDAGAQIQTGESALTGHARKLLDDYYSLDEDEQTVVRDLVALMADRARAQRAEDDSRHNATRTRRTSSATRGNVDPVATTPNGGTQD